MQRVAEGIKGEVLAKEFLIEKGYRILGENVNFPGAGELDIVALYKDTLVFVEVRTRTTLAFGHPFDTVNFAKRKKFVRAADCYLSTCRAVYNDVRFDIIAVVGTEVEHLEDAFYGKMLR